MVLKNARVYEGEGSFTGQARERVRSHETRKREDDVGPIRVVIFTRSSFVRRDAVSNVRGRLSVAPKRELPKTAARR
jgi:hypothetical protein